MRAIAFTEHGSLDNLQLMNLPDPQPAANEVLIKVAACGLNHLDIWTREGWQGLQVPMPHILGNDVVGTVEEVGNKVQGWKKGELVMVAPGLGCNQCVRCKAGQESLCANYQMMGLQRQGGYAEFTTAPASELIRIDNTWTTEEWAATPLVFLTAWHMLFGRAQLKPKETVLIHAAGSGIGSAGIQLAKHFGANVIATAGSDWKLQRARELGADHTINYTTHPEFHKQVQEITKGAGVDVVFEHIGPQTWNSSLKSLAKGGRVVFCGSTSGPKVDVDLRFTFMRQHSILGSYMGDKHELIKAVELLKQKKVKPILDSVFPLVDAKKAQEKMLSREIFGKLVLKV